MLRFIIENFLYTEREYPITTMALWRRIVFMTSLYTCLCITLLALCFLNTVCHEPIFVLMYLRSLLSAC